MLECHNQQLAFDFKKPKSKKKDKSGANAIVKKAVSFENELEAHQKRIAGFLSMVLPEAVDVIFTDNKSTMISQKRSYGRLKVRLHKMFRLADDYWLKILALFLLNKDTENTNKELDRFIKLNKSEIRQHKPGTQKLVTDGKHYNLSYVLEKVQKRYFDGQGEVAIGWAKKVKKRSRRTRSRSRALATYNYQTKTIKVSPVLDSPKVPEYVMDWVVYHEMLHHVLPIQESNGRRFYHTSRFRALERAFAEYDKAKKWETENLDWLLR